MRSKTLLKGILCFFMVSAMGCLQENGGIPATEPPRSEAGAIRDRDFTALLREQGLNPEGMQDLGNGFVVEGDLYVAKEDLLALRAAPLAKTSQRHYGHIMSDARANQVRLLIHSSISAWTKDIMQAVNFWNNVNSGAHIYVVTTNPTTTIGSDTWTGFPADMRNLPESVCGRTYYYLNPDPSPGPWVSLNLDSPQECDFSDQRTRIKIFTHELGHVLRLAHTNETTRTLISGTPTLDGLSTMNMSMTGGPHYPSLWDRKSLQILYPQDIPMFSTNLDLDSRDDITVWRPANGTWYSLRSSTNFTSSLSRQWGARGDYPLSDTDIDGDGKSDLVVWRPDNSVFYIRTSGSSYANSLEYQWGGHPDIPLPAMNVDSDNKDDLITWQWETGNWNILKSSSGYTESQIIQWGQAGDIPVPATDLDFDGKEDLVIYRPLDGKWYVLKSTSGYTTSSVYPWGNITMVPVPGTDFDNDGKDDIAVLDPKSGSMHILTSKSNFTQSMLWSLGFYGNTPIGETSVDSDNRPDLLVWNRLDNTWRARTQSSNFSYTPSWTFGM